MDYLKTQYDIVKIDPNVNYESEDESDDCDQSSVDMDIDQFCAADQVMETTAFVNEKSNQIVAELSPQQNSIKFKEKEVDKHVNENRSSHELNSLPRDTHIILQETADTTMINKDKNDNDIVMEIHSNDSKLVVDDKVVVIAGDGNNNKNKQKEHPVQIDMEVDNTLTSNLTTLNVVICDNSSNTVDSLSITPNSDNGASAADAVEGCTKKVKKKLNLQEYKIRRGNPSMTCSLNDVKDTLLEGIPKDTPTSLPPIPLPDLNNPGATVPQQNECDQEMVELDHDPEEFEEIIIVSIGCNTQMSIDPNEVICETNEESENKKTDEEESTSLTSIVNNLKKDNKQNILLSNSSLLASIQNVVTQKKQTPLVSTSTETVQPEITSEEKPRNEGEEQDHGEDKVIMHLSKYRQRPEMKTMSTQTESLPQFPPLVLLIKKCASKNPHTNIARNYRIRKVSGRSKTRSRSRSTSRSSAVSNYVSKRQRTTSFSQRNKSLSSSMYSSSSSDSDSDYSKKSRRARSRTYSYSCSSSSSDSGSDSDSDSCDSSQSSSASYDRDREQRARRSRLCSFRSNKSAYSNRSNYSQSRASFSRSRSRSSRRSKSPRHHLFYENNRRRNSRAKQNFNRNANITAEREFASFTSICNSFKINFSNFRRETNNLRWTHRSRHNQKRPEKNISSLRTNRANHNSPKRQWVRLANESFEKNS